MFAAQYCVTPTKRPGIRLPEKATSFLRDVKRRSLRVKRSKSLVINPPGADKRKSGKTSQPQKDAFLDRYASQKCMSIIESLLLFKIKSSWVCKAYKRGKTRHACCICNWPVNVNKSEQPQS